MRLALALGLALAACTPAEPQSCQDALASEVELASALKRQSAALLHLEQLATQVASTRAPEALRCPVDVASYRETLDQLQTARTRAEAAERELAALHGRIQDLRKQWIDCEHGDTSCPDDAISSLGSL